MSNDKYPNLDFSEIENKAVNAFNEFDLAGKRILAVIPDNTRTAPIDIMFRLFYRHYIKNVKALDFMVALGTHPLLNMDQKLKRIGVTLKDYNELYSKIKIMNHRWDIPETFIKIGSLSKGEISELTSGILNEGVDITINRTIFNYDKLLILGPVFPHEIAGFSGSNKYLFPGIGGWDFIDTTHWLGALVTNMNIIGIKDTPVRRLIDRARDFIDMEIVYFNIVMHKNDIKGLFIGNNRLAWEKAVELSSKVNIQYIDKPIKNVLSIPSEKYDDFWTASKGVYKLEPIVEDGGNIIVYAPNVKEFSYTHGKIIDRVGFHIKDYFLANFDRFKNEPPTVLAHCALVKGQGEYRNSVEYPRINIHLSTGIDKERCKKVNIGYINPKKIDVEKYKNNDDYFVVENAGEILYRLS